jgi:hypothetical protein
MKASRKPIFILALLTAWNLVMAQSKNKDSLVASGVLIDLSYAAQLPAGDLAQLFGFNSNVQIAVFYKSKSNWLYGIQGAFIFGNILNENIFNNMATNDGNLIANDGNYPQINYFERGWDGQLSIGKLFPVRKSNTNSGIFTIVSAGYIQHYIRIESNSDWTPQISGNYAEGYDHLTAGACITEYGGYQYISKHHYVNFLAGFEFTQALTKSLRFDFATMSQDTKLKDELLNGIRVGWILPILKEPVNEFYRF